VEQIIKSLRPIALLVAGAVVFVLGTAFLIVADASLSPSSLGSSSDLGQAGRWLQFLAGAFVFAAVCVAGWELILRSDWVAAAEIAAAALGTLLLLIGLVANAASNGSTTAGPATSAVGIGIWALLVLSRAARVSLTEQGTANNATGARPTVPEVVMPTVSDAGKAVRRGQAELWLAAAVGLFILAIGYGFNPSGGEGLDIAAGLLEAIGVAFLAGSVAQARSRGLLQSRPVAGILRPVASILIGLALLAVSFLAAAIVAGLNFGTLGALGAGLAVVTAVQMAGVAALGLAAWTQVRELYK
jgi:hypothetical protein